MKLNRIRNCVGSRALRLCAILIYATKYTLPSPRLNPTSSFKLQAPGFKLGAYCDVDAFAEPSRPRGNMSHQERARDRDRYTTSQSFSLTPPARVPDIRHLEASPLDICGVAMALEAFFRGFGLEVLVTLQLNRRPSRHARMLYAGTL